MRGYGIEPIVPNLEKGETPDHYVNRLWDDNAHNILFNKNGLTLKNRNAILGSDLIKKQEGRRWLLEQENSIEWNNGWFAKLPYQERKFLMLVNGFEDYEKDAPDIQRFRISHVPHDVKIEGGVPTANQLYIAHPYRTGVYLPVSKYESLIFRERVHELSKVMMALGATEIRTIRNSGYKSQSSFESSTRTSGSVSYGGKFDFGGSRSTGSQFGVENESDEAIFINFRNDPIQQPYVPQGLVWYPHDRDWQQIADNRLHGNLLEYEIKILSKEVNLISNSERSNIEAQARVLLASGSFSRETSSSSIFKEESAKSTSIYVRFKSRKDY